MAEEARRARGARRAAVRDLDRQGGHRDSVARRRNAWRRFWWRKARRSGSTPWSDASAMEPVASAAPAAASAPAPAPAAPQRRSAAAPQSSYQRRRRHRHPRRSRLPMPTVVEETAGPLSPLVRKMARENNIDLSQVRGTGAGGRITKQDLEAYLAQQPAQAAPLRRSSAASAASPRAAAAVASRSLPPVPAPTQPPTPQRQPRRHMPGEMPRHARRAHEHHAPEDRRAHGVQQAHLGARHHRPQSRHDAASPSCATASRASSRRSTASA